MKGAKNMNKYEEMKERQKRNQANGHWRILNVEK